MCGSYCILVNTDLMDENDIEIGSGWGIPAGCDDQRCKGWCVF